MRKGLLLFLIGLSSIIGAAGQSQIESYIAQWAPTAVREMYRSGVPASITLAQGILESRYGLSTLAADGNNHFGIKCHKDWTGKKQYYDDDAKGECFRVYDTADESFRDHSDFLRYRDRYKFLFDFETTDYKSWAYGLKKAGYATDPGYPGKLIKYIEDFRLYDFDGKTVEQVYDEGGSSVLPLTAEEDYPSAIPESPLKIEEPQPYGGKR
jgi:flagellum-specific peptidoglycan hydrolase FlgJ